MIEIYRVQLTKAALAQIDSAERSLLLLLGHVSNEIIVLQKILLQMREPVERPHIVQIVSSGQMLIVLRVLIGKLSEAWRLFEKRVKANPAMRETYIENLPPEAQTSLDWLNKEFGKGSALQQIRNRLSNHYIDDEDLIEANFHQLGDNEAWDFFIGETPANTFFYASELVVTRTAISIIEAKSKSQDNNAFDELVQLCTFAAGHVADLFNHTITMIVDRRLPDVVVRPIDVGPVEKLSELRLPFFLDHDDLIKGRSGVS